MSFDLISLILQAGLIVKLVLLLLLGFSLSSLTIIVVKWWELRAADQDSEAFLEVYRREGFSGAFDAARPHRHKGSSTSCTRAPVFYVLRSRFLHIHTHFSFQMQ